MQGIISMHACEAQKGSGKNRGRLRAETARGISAVHGPKEEEEAFRSITLMCGVCVSDNVHPVQCLTTCYCPMPDVGFGV